MADVSQGIAGVCFLIAAFFLKRFVDGVQKITEVVNDLVTRVSVLESERPNTIAPVNVGSFNPPRVLQNPTPFPRQDWR